MTVKSTKFTVKKSGSYITVSKGTSPIISGSEQSLPGVCNAIMLIGLSVHNSTYKTKTIRTAMKVLLNHYSKYALIMHIARSDKNKNRLFDPKLWNRKTGFPGNYYKTQGDYTLDVYFTNPSYISEKGLI